MKFHKGYALLVVLAGGALALWFSVGQSTMTRTLSPSGRALQREGPVRLQKDSSTASHADVDREGQRVPLQELELPPGIEVVDVRAWVPSEVQGGATRWESATSGFVRVQTVGESYAHTARVGVDGRVSARVPEFGTHFFSDAFLNGRTARPLRVELTPPPWDEGQADGGVAPRAMLVMGGHGEVHLLCEYSEGAHLYIEGPTGAVVPWYWIAPERRDPSCSNPTRPDLEQRRAIQGNRLLCRQGWPEWSWIAADGTAWQRVLTQCEAPSPGTLRLKAGGSLEIAIEVSEASQGGLNDSGFVQLELREISSPFPDGQVSIALPRSCFASEVPSTVRMDHLPAGRLQICVGGAWRAAPLEVDVVQGQVSTVGIVLEAEGHLLAALRGRIALTSEAPRGEWRRGRLWSVPVTWEEHAAPYRIELSADTQEPSIYEFLASGLEPGRYRFAFEELGWSEVVTLAGGELKLVESVHAPSADVQLHLFDEDSGAPIHSASVYVNGSLDPAATSSGHSSREGSDTQPADETIERNAFSFTATSGESQLFVRTQGYLPIEVREWLSPGLNVITLSMKPTCPVWLRFSQPVEPALEKWALGVDVWRYGESQVALEVIPARYVGAELTHIYLDFTESGRYLLSWPRAGESIAPVQLEVCIPRDRDVELVVPIEALKRL